MNKIEEQQRVKGYGARRTEKTALQSWESLYPSSKGKLNLRATQWLNGGTVSTRAASTATRNDIKDGNQIQRGARDRERLRLDTCQELLLRNQYTDAVLVVLAHSQGRKNVPQG